MAMPDLGKQIGPLPLGAWVIVVGGGLGIAYYTRNAGKDAVPVTDTSGDPGVGAGGSGSWVQTGPPANDSNTGGPVIATNDDWGRAAVNLLIARGMDASAADQAVRKYLSGAQLSVMERAMITIALTALGSPPTPLPPAPDNPKPGPPPNQNPGPYYPPDHGTGTPPAPGNLRLISQSGNKVRVGWNSVSWSSGYFVYLDGKKVSALHTGTWFTVSNIPSGSHTISVRTYNLGKNLSPASSITVNIGATSKPGLPPKNPGPKPPAPKPRVRYYTVARNDNLWNIAKRFYGNPLKWVSIYNANRKGVRRSDGTTGMISTPNLIQPGWRLIIP